METIRKLRKEDAYELAVGIATIWNDTYKDIVDADFLEGLYSHIAENEERLKSSVDTDENYHILEVDGKIAGWLRYTYDSDKLDDSAEVHVLYVLKEYQKCGYGKLLLDFAFDDIKSHNIKKVVIGCLDGNKSNDFYKHMGGKFIKTSVFREKYTENIYLFEI